MNTNTVRLFGRAGCRDSFELRDFMQRSAVPFEWVELKSDDDLIDLEFNAICREQAIPVLEVPIFSTSRHSGRSTTNLGSALRMYSGVFRLRRELKGQLKGQ